MAYSYFALPPPLYTGNATASDLRVGYLQARAAYFGNTQVWPTYSYSDDFESNTISNYTITGGALTIINGRFGISGTTDGERRVRCNVAQMGTDDVYIRATIGTTGTRNTSLVFRLSLDGNSWVALNMINGTSYLQRIRASDGVATDITSVALSTTTGATVEIYATGDRYRILRNGVELRDVVDTEPCRKGPDYRWFGMRFTRSSFANSPSLETFQISDQY